MKFVSNQHSILSLKCSVLAARKKSFNVFAYLFMHIISMDCDGFRLVGINRQDTAIGGSQ